jgi:hypothetical protein
MDPRQAHNLGPPDIEFGQRCGKGNGFGKPMFGQPPRRGGLPRRMQNPGARGLCHSVTQPLPFARGDEIGIVIGVA